MSSTTTITTPLANTLCLLGAYTSALSKGNENLKSCRFNLTKARRHSGHSVGSTVGYSPDELREDLFALAVLKCDDEEPTLVDDNKDGGGGKNEHESDCEATPAAAGGGGDVFELYLDGIPKTKKNDAPTTNLVTESTTTTTTGLRQRKNAPTTNQEESKWTTDISSSQEENKEKEMTSPENTNPINMFCGYLPPRSLKVSQENAKEALKHYVEAANLVAEINKILNDLEEGKKGVMQQPMVQD